MIGPLLVYIYEHDERSDYLYYLYQGENGQGIASKEYIDELPDGDEYKETTLSGAMFDSHEEIMDTIDYVNKREREYGYPADDATYQVEYAFYSTISRIDELLKL